MVRGDWRSSDYSVEVALKTLSGEEGPEGRRKLLQEAAIMSQFRHPNVVKLYGVVSDDQQVHCASVCVCVCDASCVVCCS